MKHSYHTNTYSTNIDFAKTIVGRLKVFSEELPDELTLNLSETLEPLREQFRAPRRKIPVHMVLGDHAPPEPLPALEDEPLMEKGVDLTDVLGVRGSDRAYLSLHMSYNQVGPHALPNNPARKLLTI